MFENKTSVLLILSQDVLDRARVLAGKATTALKLPVSLQIVLRALIEEGLKRDDHPALLANGNVLGARALLDEGSAKVESRRLGALDLTPFARAVRATIARIGAGEFDWSLVPRFPREE